MDNFKITCEEELESFKTYISEQNLKDADVQKIDEEYTIQFEPHEKFTIPTTPGLWKNRDNIVSWILKLKPNDDIKHFIFGKNDLENIVSCEVKGNNIEIFTEKDGIISTIIKPHQFWLLSPEPLDKEWKRLGGELHYKYIKLYNHISSFFVDKKKYKLNDKFTVGNAKESAMLLYGFTYFKGMKIEDVSILHFDLETTGLVHDETSHVLLISTTFKKQGEVFKKLFSVDEYDSEGEMISAFCAYLKEKNPSIVSGFNILGFDLPYLRFCADKCNVSLSLGRDDSDIRFDNYPSYFRKDMSQKYEYTNCFIYGREIVDMMFVAYHYDFKRKYESYGLKNIIRQEKLEKPNRQFYDAKMISKNWNIPEERAKIKEYCIDDSDDNMSLYHLMIPAFFYLSQSVPQSFQMINCRASGAQLNSFLIRSYLQQGHSIPKSSEVKKYKGALSGANPGIYRNCWKVDVSSLYPSVIIQYDIYDKEKDPKKHFLKMVTYFTHKRLEHKRLSQETGNRHYSDLEQMEKIFINSAYGLLGAPGINFNSVDNADLVTAYGRNVLKDSMLWATGEEFKEITKATEEDEELMEEEYDT